MRIWWLIAALLLSALLAALQWWAVADFLYWRYSWFDVPMHFLGGLTLGVLAVAFWNQYLPHLFFLSVAIAFIGWEVFEFVFGLPREANYPLDTALDLIMDTLGALAAYAAARHTLWKAS